MRLDVGVANLAVAGSTLPGTARWFTATHRVRATQARLWAAIRDQNVNTTYGRQHGFAGRSITDLSQLPIMTGDDLNTAVKHWRSGDQHHLTAEPITRLIPTSGTSGGRKEIPSTASLLAQFQAGIDPWLCSLYRRYPSMLGGSAYWQITPVLTDQEDSDAEASNDTEYLGRFRAAVMARLMAVPDTVAKMRQLEHFHLQTLRHLIARRDLAFISVWNPSFLMLLLDALPSHAGPLIIALRRSGQDARADELLRILGQQNSALDRRDAKGRTWVEQLWPRLTAVSCWADANAAPAARELARRLPNVAIEPKGLVATEGIISFPWQRGEHALAVTSHVFEFLPENGDEKTARLADELSVGHRYRVLITTGGGLYRYSLGDVVEVTGYVNQCPLLRFVGRHDGVSDLVGEKLSPAHVQRIVSAVLAEHNGTIRFWMVAPEQRDQRYGYTLYLHLVGDLPAVEQIITRVEAGFSENPHYRYARQLGQLDGIRLFRINDTAQPEGIYLLRGAVNKPLGQIKPPVLDRRLDWSTVFPGSFVFPRSQ